MFVIKNFNTKEEKYMLSEKIIDRLNKQINLEFYSSNLYLQMSSWCDANGFPGSARFLKEHAAEEQEHMHKLFNYVNEAGAMAILGSIEAPKHEYKDIIDIFKQTYEHEVFITGEINNLVSLALDSRDFATFNFLQWYVAEQHEEENLFQSILDRIKILDNEPKNLFFLDNEISKMVTSE